MIRHTASPTQTPPYMSDAEWDEAAMFGQFSRAGNDEEVVMFRRIDLASYLSMLQDSYLSMLEVESKSPRAISDSQPNAGNSVTAGRDGQPKPRTTRD